MFRKWKKVIAAVLSSAMIFSCAGCTIGTSTAYALTVDGYQVKAGVYIYYAYSALSEAKSLAASQNEGLDTEDDDALRNVKLDGKDFVDYVKDKATELCVNHVAVLKHFDELELELTDEQKEELEDYVDSAWEANEDMFKGNGISKESITEIMDSTYKSDELFKAYYGEDGSENVTDAQMQDYYTENNARVRYIDMDLHDAEGNDLDDAGKKELQAMAEDFKKRAEKYKDDEEKMLEEFVVFQEEYDKYVADMTAEAVDEESEETPAETEAETEAVTETEPATEAETEPAEGETEAVDTTDAEAETDADNESSAEGAVTTAPESEEETEETTTTVSPQAYESIIQVVTTDENTKEEDLTYSPSKKCYDWIFDSKTNYCEPEIIEDEHTLYVIVKLDIEERMTDDDLWNESNIENVRYSMFSDEMQDMLDSWGDEYEVVKNEKAYKRYDPFDIKDAEE